jgi:c-di-AMP phosphodiesterase-like protein
MTTFESLIQHIVFIDHHRISKDISIDNIANEYLEANPDIPRKFY